MLLANLKIGFRPKLFDANLWSEIGGRRRRQRPEKKWESLLRSVKFSLTFKDHKIDIIRKIIINIGLKSIYTPLTARENFIANLNISCRIRARWCQF